MIPVKQTITDPKDGNCLQACIASILELPLDEVPHFTVMEGYWYDHLIKWLHKRDLDAMVVQVYEGEPHIPHVYHVATYETRGCNHAVVAHGPHVVWDPQEDSHFIPENLKLVDRLFILR